MFAGSNNATVVKNTTHKVVLPFYLYAACLFLPEPFFYFFRILHLQSITFIRIHWPLLISWHLGWGTMIILGACHQLLPVISRRQLI